MASKILSMDGGGSWALIQARVLKDIYGDISGHELLRKFDLVIANSGGSLVLACLCNNMLLSEALKMFENEETRKNVFAKLTFWDSLKKIPMISVLQKAIKLFGAKTILGPKYNTEKKLKGLISELEKVDKNTSGQFLVSRYLDELPLLIGKPELEIMIVGYDYFSERVTFFRSNLTGDATRFNRIQKRVKLSEAIHASSNAPVNYFEEPAKVNLINNKTNFSNVSYFWDGAISGFNNPILAGLIEALINKKVKLEEFEILSIGTGTGKRMVITDFENNEDPELKNIYQINRKNELVIAETKSDFINDIVKVSKSILGDPPDSATFMAYTILDPTLSNNAKIVRINPCLSPKLNSNKIVEIPEAFQNISDGRNKFIKLLDMDMDAVEQNEVELIIEMTNHFIVTNSTQTCIPNQLIRGEADFNHIGQSTYREAKDRWLEIIGNVD